MLFNSNEDLNLLTMNQEMRFLNYSAKDPPTKTIAVNNGTRNITYKYCGMRVKVKLKCSKLFTLLQL